MTTQTYTRIKGRWLQRGLAVGLLVIVATQLTRFEDLWWTLLVFSPAIAYGVFLWTRDYNVRVEIEGEKVRIINPLRTYHLTKSDVQALRWHNGWECKKGEVVCRDGSRLIIAGLKQPYMRRDELADEEMARLREDLGISNVDDTSNPGNRTWPT